MPPVVHHAQDDAQQMFNLFGVPEYTSNLLHFSL